MQSAGELRNQQAAGVAEFSVTADATTTYVIGRGLPNFVLSRTTSRPSLVRLNQRSIAYGLPEDVFMDMPGIGRDLRSYG
jgi:hypothetical protein